MNYLNWQKDVEEFNIKLKTEIDKNINAHKFYNGFYVWDSKVVQNPDIMFIGINPGNGNPNNNKSVKVVPEEQMSYLEYLDGENPSYTLARETVDVFSKMGYSNEYLRNYFNDKTIKTNFFHIITTSELDIANCLNSLVGYNKKQYELDSYVFTAKLIDILRPKLIIFEGKGVFELFKDYDDCVNYYWQDNVGYMERENGTKILGYSRTFSNIKNKEKLADLIKLHLTA